jgi:hypothetical protein
MAYTWDMDEDNDPSEQPTEPIPVQNNPATQPVIITELLVPRREPDDDATTWPELWSVDVERLIANAVARTHERPCPVCLYARAIAGEVVEIGPELPRVCITHMHQICSAPPAERVTLHEIYRFIYDWYHTPDEYVG